MSDLFKPVNPGLTLADINRKNKALWGPTKDAPKMTNEELKKSGYAALFTRWQKEEENK